MNYVRVMHMVCVGVNANRHRMCGVYDPSKDNRRWCSAQTLFLPDWKSKQHRTANGKQTTWQVTNARVKTPQATKEWVQKGLNSHQYQLSFGCIFVALKALSRMKKLHSAISSQLTTPNDVCHLMACSPRKDQHGAQFCFANELTLSLIDTVYYRAARGTDKWAGSN